MSHLVHDILFDRARATPDAPALQYADKDGHQRRSYAELAEDVRAAARALLAHGLAPGERVAVYMEKRIENVCAMLGAAAAGGVFVPVNPLLKAEQVRYILADCNVRILVTTAERYTGLRAVLADCPDLQAVYVVNGGDTGPAIGWHAALAQAPERHGPTRIDADMAAILYTSGSTGAPKGVVLSHRNLVAGAHSVASYLEIAASDRVLSVLPLSFDYGLSQLTTAFLRGAHVVLMNHLFARDIPLAVARHGITVLAAVPPLWNQLARLPWEADCTLRILTNSGGAMPRQTTETLVAALPRARLFLMYGLTEAFRSTYLAPEEVVRRPDSIGRAIPNAEIMVVRPDGTPCGADEEGELVHRGALVALGYWNDPARSAERFRPAPGQHPALALPELAVWSGDTVRRDADGFLYFVGRVDDMIKVSGYRISPTEIEEVLYASGMVVEAAAFGIDDAQLGQSIVAVVLAQEGVNAAALLKECQRRLPAYMVPARIELAGASLPRNPNGKIDRSLLRRTLSQRDPSAP